MGEKAAFDIIGDSRYNVKRSFDVMQSAASNEGGNFATAGIGLGIGAGAGITLGNNFANLAAGVGSKPAKKTTCKNCGMLNEDGVKFCSNCGEKILTAKIECYSCKNLVDDNMKFCPNCGCLMEKRICPTCQTENLPGARFCNKCGTKLEA